MQVAALYINTAMVHLDLHHTKTALRYLHASLRIYESVLGEVLPPPTLHIYIEHARPLRNCNRWPSF